MDYYSLVISLLSQGSYAILSFAVGYLLKIELRRIHEKGQSEHKISYADEASAEEIYGTYHALGGNGQGTSMVQDIRKLPKA